MKAKETAPKVPREEFERIVGNLLRQKPTTRAQQKTGKRKDAATIIPPVR